MFKNFLKGMVMGLANIIPGVSGGTLAVSMGIYDKLIHCLTHLFREFKESIRFVLPIILGMIVALAGLSFVITPAFEHFPLQTNGLWTHRWRTAAYVQEGKGQQDQDRTRDRVPDLLCHRDRNGHAG